MAVLGQQCRIKGFSASTLRQASHGIQGGGWVEVSHSKVEVQSDETQCLHAHRAAGRHRDYWCAGRPALTRRSAQSAPRQRTVQCQNNLRQIGLGTLQYYDANQGQFFLHHPFNADVLANLADANSFAEIYWEDKIMPFIGAWFEANAAAVSAGQNNPTEKIFRCPEDNSLRTVFVNDGVNDGWANRTSYLLNSQLSHKTRRWGHWNFASLARVGTSNFIDYCERSTRASRTTSFWQATRTRRLRHLARRQEFPTLDRHHPAYRHRQLPLPRWTRRFLFVARARCD